MALFNRGLDPSQAKEILQVGAQAVVNGTTLVVGVVPYPANVVGGQMAVWGVSGAPSVALAVNRFIAGTGFTTIVIGTGTSNTPAEFGTSGIGSFGTSLFGSSGMVLAAAGSTLMQLQANDLLIATQAGGSGAATKFTQVAVVIQPTQDVKYRFGTGV